MNNLRVSPQSLSYLLVSLIFVPRFFSDVAYQTGTVLILIFWIIPFVLIAEMANENWTEKMKLTELPKVTLYISLSCLIIISASFYWRELIYADSINPYQNIKRSLYLINPLILLGWAPFIRSSQKRSFLIIFSILTVGLFSCLTIPKIFDITFIGGFLNNLTASISSFILSLSTDIKVKVDASFIYVDTKGIKVGGGCSSTPQIMISLYASLTLYICCKIRSKVTIVFYILIAILVAFIFNSTRISILGYLVSIDKVKMFDFWHDGAGSLIFSFVVMLFTCSIYYFLWAKENPIDKEIKQNNEGSQKN